MTTFIKPEEIEAKIKENDFVVIAVAASWCGPCQMMTSTVWNQINEEKNDISIYKIDADEHRDWATSNNVSGLPTMFIYRKGIKASEISGYVPREQFEENVRG
ncbi:thioredoxin family protein [Mycoplasma marinum]|uniref:Thioredoxin n=1 Tax=Mycoplasma marinum TaxID=1937190 RepID=A0A4R0XWZ4_9MOLU|nr:thioredoxin family protein [Mycoplasma marinum]TCG11521.1 hypothetical protein C4B24_01590 [Mycoplasma marinum]